MALTRNNLLPQHNFSGAHYGTLPLAALPSGTTTGDVFLWSGSNWIITNISGVAAGAESGGPFELVSGTWQLIAGVHFLKYSDSTSYIYLGANYAEIGDGTTGLSFEETKQRFSNGEGVIWPNVAADPDIGDSEEGQTYFNTVTKKFRGFDGTSWVDLN